MKFRIVSMVTAATCLVACGPAPAPADSAETASSTAPAPVADTADGSATQDAPLQRVNPASANCASVGGRLVIEKRPDGSEFGVCYFEDNRQCEEWALLRRECPVGGRRITGYATQAGRYCAITGGEYTGVVARDDRETGTCALPDGMKCEAEAYWHGSCSR